MAGHPLPRALVLTAALILPPAVSILANASQESIDLQSSYTPPQDAACIGAKAFDMRLSESSERSTVHILQRGVPGTPNGAITEFQPSQPNPPFTRFFYQETPQSHRVSWAMGAVFYQTEALAAESAAKMAAWYSDKLKVPLQESYVEGMYLLRLDGLNLTVSARGNWVRVSCEHIATAGAVIEEGIGAARTR